MRTHYVTRDANEVRIVWALELAGARCALLHPIQNRDNGIPDLLVGYREINYLLEVKRPGEKLKKHQERWHHLWPGLKPVMVRSIREAAEAIGMDVEFVLSKIKR